MLLLHILLSSFLSSLNAKYPFHKLALLALKSHFRYPYPYSQTYTYTYTYNYPYPYPEYFFHKLLSLFLRYKQDLIRPLILSFRLSASSNPGVLNFSIISFYSFPDLFICLCICLCISSSSCYSCSRSRSRSRARFPEYLSLSAAITIAIEYNISLSTEHIY